MKKPNILFILSDDHSAEAVSLYGSRLAGVFETPNIDRIGREGVAAERCFCTNALCTPSRASILTGLYPHKNGVKTLTDALPEKVPTFPELMHAAGYQTALFGKWHVHAAPRGFDEYAVLPAQGVYWNPSFLYGKDDWEALENIYADVTDVREAGYVTDLITDKCLDWLAHKRDAHKPFLLMCHHKAPHDNFEYHPRYERLFDGVEIPEPESLWEDFSHRSAGSRLFGGTVSERNPRRNAVKTMSAPDYPTGALDVRGLTFTDRARAAYQKYLKDYLRTVKGIDDNVGRLLTWLDENGLAEDTIVVYTSDQGMFLGEHDYIDKRWIYEEAMRMPLLVRWPREIAAGCRTGALLSNIDFAPWLLDCAGIAAPTAMQGRSFRSLLAGGAQNGGNEYIYYHYWLHLAHLDTPAHMGVRTVRYKLAFFYGRALDASDAVDCDTPAGIELYDLERDPHEMRNVYHDPAYADAAADMRALFLRALRETGEDIARYPALDAMIRQYFQEG